MSQKLEHHISSLAQTANDLGIDEFLLALTGQFPGAVTFSTSFSYEDQVITHKILRNNLQIELFCNALLRGATFLI